MIRQMKKTLTDHSDSVIIVAFSPDDQHIVSESSDKTIKIWDMTTKQIEKILTDHSNSISAVAFSSDS